MKGKKNKITLKQRMRCRRLEKVRFINGSIKGDLTNFYIKVYEKMKDMNYFKEPYKICAGAFNPDLSNRTVNRKTGLPLNTMQDYIDYLTQFIITPYNILIVTQLMLSVMMYVRTSEMSQAFEDAIKDFIDKNKDKDQRVKEIFDNYDNYDVKEQIESQAVNKEAENSFLIYLCTIYHMKNVMTDVIKHCYNVINRTKNLEPETSKNDPLYDMIENDFFKDWIANKEPFIKMHNHVEKLFKVNDKWYSFISAVKVRYFAILGEITNFFNWLFGNKPINTFDYYKEQLFNNKNLSNMKYFQKMFIETATNLNRANKVLINLEKIADVLYMFVKGADIPQELYDTYFNDNYNKTMTSLITLYENCSELFALAYDTTHNLCLEYKIRNRLGHD